MLRFLLRQKQLRKNHIRDHIETSLNWKGKKMPTAEEVKNYFKKNWGLRKVKVSASKLKTMTLNIKITMQVQARVAQLPEMIVPQAGKI